MRSLLLLVAVVTAPAFISVAAVSRMPDYMQNFTTNNDGTLIQQPSGVLSWRFSNATVGAAADSGTSIPELYRLPGLPNPIIALQPRNVDVTATTAPDTLAGTWKANSRPLDNAWPMDNSRPTFMACVAAEGFAAPQTDEADALNVFFSGGYNARVRTNGFFSSLLTTDGTIQAYNFTLQPTNACGSGLAAACSFDLVFRLHANRINLTSDDINMPAARIYVTSVKLDTGATMSAEECPPDLLARIRAYKAAQQVLASSGAAASSLASSSSVVATASSTAATNTDSSTARAGQGAASTGNPATSGSTADNKPSPSSTSIVAGNSTSSTGAKPQAPSNTAASVFASSVSVSVSVLLLSSLLAVA